MLALAVVEDADVLPGNRSAEMRTGAVIEAVELMTTQLELNMRTATIFKQIEIRFGARTSYVISGLIIEHLNFSNLYNAREIYVFRTTVIKNSRRSSARE